LGKRRKTCAKKEMRDALQRWCSEPFVGLKPCVGRS
jgi:hypothetical protein